MTDGRLRAMSRMYDRLVIEREYLRIYRVDQLIIVATGKIGSSDRSQEKTVTDKHDLLLLF